MFQTCNDLTSLRNSLADQIHSNAKWPEVKEILDEALERAAYLGASLKEEKLMKITPVWKDSAGVSHGPNTCGCSNPKNHINLKIDEVNELEFPPI